MHFQMTIDKDELNLELLKKLKALIDGPGKITLTFRAEEGMVISKEEPIDTELINSLDELAEEKDVVSFSIEEFEKYSNELLRNSK